jgi:multiple sugar transport system permease protein
MRQRGQRLVPLALLLPAMALVVVVVLLPAVQAIVLAFTEESGAFGVGSIQGVLGDLAFTEAARNAVVLLVVLVPLQLAVAAGIAALLRSRLRGTSWLLYLAAVPLAVSDLAAGLLWLALFTERGYVNSALQSTGLIAQPVPWLVSGNIAGMVLAVVLAETWRTTSIFVVALLDGVRWRSVGSAIAVRALLVLQTFALVFALAGRNLAVPAGQAYEHFVTTRDDHAAAVYVVAILVLGLVASVFYLRAAAPRDAVLA